MPSAARPRNGLRVVALLEACKGAVVLVAGFGLLTALHQGAAQVVEELARHMHMNPAQGYPQIFVEWAADTSNGQLRLLAMGAFGYAAMRVTEAFGLWWHRRWAQWFSIASGAVYVPIELYKIATGFSLLNAALLLANLGIVAYMAHTLRLSRSTRG